MDFKIVNGSNIDSYLSIIETTEPFDEFEDKIGVLLPNNIFQNLIENINQNSLLNPAIDSSIKIRFENFNFWDTLKMKLMEWYQKKDIMVAQYNPKRKTVSIKKELLTSDLMSTFADGRMLLNFTALHEIGHSVHQALYQTEQNSITVHPDLQKLVAYSKNNLPQHDILANIIEENFCDIYASVALIILNVPDAIPTISKMRQFRVKTSEMDYQTHNALEEIETNVQIIKSLPTMQDVVSYIETLTIKQVKLQLESDLTTHLIQEILPIEYLGYLDSILINSGDIGIIKKHLKNSLNLDIPVIYENREEFKRYKVLKTSLSTKINKIRKDTNIIKNAKLK